MDIQVTEWGLGFVLECFRRFQGEGVFFFFFVVALVVFWYAKKHEHTWVMLYILGLGITVYNPVIVPFVVEKLELSDEYYRLLWLLPITILIAWMAAWIIRKMPKVWMQVIACLTFMAILALPGKSILDRDFSLAENLYKIPDEVIEICDVMHEWTEEEQITVYADFDLTVLMNQYDPSYEMALSYGDVSNFKSSYDPSKTAEYEEYFSPSMISKWFLYQIYERNYQGLEIPDAARSFAWLYVDYVILNKTDAMYEYTLTQNCIPVYETQNYVVMEFLGE